MANHLLILSIWTAKVGSQTYGTCAEVMQSHDRYNLSDGVYAIANTDNGTSLDLYCSFDYENDYAWTLFESGSKYKLLRDLRAKGFSTDYPQNIDDVDTSRFTMYRLSYDWMNYLQSNSEFLLATCQFNTSLVKDYTLFDVSQFDIFSLDNTDYFNSSCSSGHISTNIKGVACNGSTISIFGAPLVHPHLYFRSEAGCNCTVFGDSAYEFFGSYWFFDTSFTCSTSESSTTQWWYGSDVSSSSTSFVPSVSPTFIPSLRQWPTTFIPSNDPSNDPRNDPSRTPSSIPSHTPSGIPSGIPSRTPSNIPSLTPSSIPSKAPSNAPTLKAENNENSTSNSNNSNNNNNNNTDLGLTIVYVAGGMIFGIVISVIIFTIISKKKKKNQESNANTSNVVKNLKEEDTSLANTTQSHQVQPIHLSQNSIDNNDKIEYYSYNYNTQNDNTNNNTKGDSVEGEKGEQDRRDFSIVAIAQEQDIDKSGMTIHLAG